MIVQPASTNPRGPVRRALRAVGLVTPAVLFVAIVGAGLAGPKPGPVVQAGTDAPEASGGLAAEAPARSPASPVPPIALAGPTGPAPGFPTVVAELSVLSIIEALGKMAASPGRPVAVAGYLDRLLPAGACPASAGDTRGLLSPLCERRARLAVASDDATSPRAHLHLRIPPGVRLPPAFEDGVTDAPMRVVIVGRGDLPGAPCGQSERGCSHRLTADLVAWADGSPFDPGPVFDAGLEVPPPAIAYRHLETARGLVVGRTGAVLVSAAVRPRTVAEIDPEAAAALAARPAPRGLVWYVRGLATAYGPGRFPAGDYPPRMQWVVLDETTGEALATGVLTPSNDASASVAPADGGFPRSPGWTSWRRGRSRRGVPGFADPSGTCAGSRSAPARRGPRPTCARRR